MSSSPARWPAATLILALSPGACRAPEPAPLDAEALVHAVAVRDASPDELGAALELAGLQPLALAPPPDAALGDPSRPEFWHACAWAWSPATRAARRRMQAAQARAGSAGSSGPIRGVLEVSDFGDPGAQSRLMVTFDMIGLFGLGPAAAARALADAETRAALNGLEEAMWTARFAVEAARVRLAAVRASRESLQALMLEAESEEARITILDRNGRLATASLAVARFQRRRLADRLANLAIEEARAREELALAAGLVPEAQALDVPGRDSLDVFLDGHTVDEPTPEELLERVPLLRGLLLDYAIAEARLRDEAARRWPGLQLGPHLLWNPDFLLGAVVASGLPWPGSLDGRIAAASVEREAARERVEDALLALETSRIAARERRAAADTLLTEGALPAAEESARLWQAARARFAVEPAALAPWADALMKRAQALHALELARAELALATLDLEQAAGLGPEVPRLVAMPPRRPDDRGGRP